MVATLERFVRLQATGANVVDCAAATLRAGIEYDGATITGIGKLAGTGDLLEADAVAKLGRTTGATRLAGCSPW